MLDALVLGVVGLAAIFILPFLLITLWSRLRTQPESVGLLAVVLLPAAGVVLLRKEMIDGSTAVGLAGLGGAIATLVCLTQRRVRHHAPNIVTFCFLAFAAIEFTSALVNGQLSMSPTEMGSTLTLWVGPLVAFRVTKSIAPAELGKALLIGAVSLLVVSYGVEIAFPADAASTESRYFNWSIGRLAGATTSANALGAVGLLLAIASILTCRGRARMALIALAVPAVLLSQQRAALLGLILALLASAQGRSRPLVLLSAGSVATAAVLNSSVWFSDSTSAAVDDETVQSRVTVWQFVAEHKWDSPLIGWGPRGTLERSLAAGLPEPYSHAHNQVVNAFAVGGVLLLAITVTILGLMLFRASTGDPSRRWRSGVVTAGLVPVFLFESPLQAVMNPLTLPQVVLTWMAVALALAPDDTSAVVDEPSPKRVRVR